jgi:hypothetical protein
VYLSHNRRLHSAESKDLGDAYQRMLFRAFRPRTTKEDKKSQPPSEAEGSAVSLNSKPMFAAEESLYDVHGLKPCRWRFIDRAQFSHTCPN